MSVEDEKRIEARSEFSSEINRQLFERIPEGTCPRVAWRAETRLDKRLEISVFSRILGLAVY